MIIKEQPCLERKVIIPMENFHWWRNLLHSRFEKDENYPANKVYSIYFDTPDLKLYHSSLNGDLTREKIRLRWYESNQSQKDFFLELKQKQGSLRQKSKLKLDSPQLNNLPFLRLNPTIKQKIKPVAQISYWRERFNHPLTNIRISLDSEINFENIDQKDNLKKQLTFAVLEVKSAPEATNLPHILERLNFHSFSKYCSFFDENHLESII